MTIKKHEVTLLFPDSKIVVDVTESEEVLRLIKQLLEYVGEYNG